MKSVIEATAVLSQQPLKQQRKFCYMNMKVECNIIILNYV